MGSEYEYVAVTACDTGIAHTYMAAEALKKAAEAAGHTIKVETIGSSGAKNVLTAEDIENAKGVIIAADSEVTMERFIGKPVVKTPIAEGIDKAEELIKSVIKAPVYQGGEVQMLPDKPRGGAKIAAAIVAACGVIAAAAYYVFAVMGFRF